METIFNVEKMMCGGCEANVKKALADSPNVDEVSVDLDAKTVTITGDIDVDVIASTISNAGYPASKA